MNTTPKNITSVLLGSTGMVGLSVLHECIEDERIANIILINRNPLEWSHPKIKEILHEDFFDFSNLHGLLEKVEACFFCMGTTSVGKNEKEYTRITYDITLAFATAMKKANSHACFCYVSGVGTDNTLEGNSMWARVKGKTENDLLSFGFRSAYMFRPGYIQPLKGIRSKTGWYNAIYVLCRPFYFLLKLLKNYVTDTTTLGRAMIQVCFEEPNHTVLETRDINFFGRK